MTDQGDSIMAISSYAGANSRRKKDEAASFDPAASAALPPLAALSRLAAPSMAPLQGPTLMPFVGTEPELFLPPEQNQLQQSTVCLSHSVIEVLAKYLLL